MSQVHKKYRPKLCTETKHSNGRYAVPLLWKDATVWLSNHQNMTLRYSAFR